jgi:signal transduction histidine kinase
MMRKPRPTARLRLTIMYGCVCLAFGIVLLTVTYLLTWDVFTVSVVPRPPSASAGPGQLSGGASQIAFDRHLLLVRSALALGVVSIAALGSGWLLAGRVLRPLSTITAAARRISASSLHERLALPGPDDELKELANTLDDLFARLEASFGSQRRFAANASHELRTPLTRERTLLQVTLADPDSTVATWRSVSKELLDSNTEQERLIEALLILANSECGLDHSEPVDLAAHTRALLEESRAGIDRLSLSVSTDIRPAGLYGDPLLVRQLASNLVGNAIRHNVHGGNIRIQTATYGGRAILSVSNSGPRIPPSEVDRLFQPFQRLGPRRAQRDNGHGLGLSIVTSIATAHRARISAQPGPDGGLTISVAFPPETSYPLPNEKENP